MSELEGMLAADMSAERASEAQPAPAANPCERCGDFAPLRVLFGRATCRACVERMPRVLREDPTALRLISGALDLIRDVPPYAWATLLAINLSAALSAALLFPASPGIQGVVTMVLSLFADLVLLTACHDKLRGEAGNARRTLLTALETYSSAFITHLYASLVVVLASVAFLIPGIVYLVRYSLVLPVVLHEGTSGGTALNRSTAYMRGFAWPYLGAVTILVGPPFILIFGAEVMAMTLNSPEHMVVGPAPLALLEVLRTTTVALTMSALDALMYINRRLAKEGFHT